MAEDKNVVGRFWEEVYNGGNLDAIDEIFAPDYELHDLVNGKSYGRDGLKGLLEQIRSEVSGAADARVTIEDQMAAEADRVVSRFKVHVPLQDAASYAAQEPAPANQWLELNGMSISRVSGGRIEESWLLWEALLAEQKLHPTSGTPDWRWPPWR